MTDLLKGMQNSKKGGPLQWSGEQDEALQALKQCFQKAPLLRHFDPNLEIRAETDASGCGIGAVLSQLHPDRWYLVVFFSKKFKSEETRYTTGDQEILVIVRTFEEWWHYLEGTAHIVTVITDYEALLKFMDTKVLSRKRQT